MAETILELLDVVKRYETGGPVATGDSTWRDGGLEVLRGVNLRVAAGESLAVVGPSGSGKSTLLNLIGGLDRPSGGRVLFEGRDLADLNDADLARFRNRRVGFVFQLHHLLPQCTVLENVLVPTLVGGDGERKEEAELRAERLLARVGLGDRLTFRPGRLSGGERERVAVARALVNRPAVLLADEPTGSLDRRTAENLMALLAELNEEEGVTLVVVTHAETLAARMGRTLELADGVLVPKEADA
jgi:predicted ABC-type transport system involved in lysophospholipase L1 biosynthesis ATPase subunit